MTNEQWIIVYVSALVLFPFIVQMLTIPLLFIADLLDKITERGKDGKHKNG